MLVFLRFRSRIVHKESLNGMQNRLLFKNCVGNTLNHNKKFDISQNSFFAGRYPLVDGDKGNCEPVINIEASTVWC